jgi:N-acylneuraminate cytidylyltransferase/CMP-N,N'-diacetyllegionaminic acid synthase
VPFERPARLASDETPTEPVVRHALETLAADGEPYHVVVLLQPTSPLRTATHVEEAFDRYVKTGADSLLSGYQSHETRWRPSSQGIKQINYEDGPIRRQNRESEYVENGAIYIVDATAFLDTGELRVGRTEIYEMNETTSVDVDDPFDLWLAEQIIYEWGSHD